MNTFKKFLEKFIASELNEIHVKASDFKVDESGKSIPSKPFINAVEAMINDKAYCKKNKIQITLNDAPKNSSGKPDTRKSRCIDIVKSSK